MAQARETQNITFAGNTVADTKEIEFQLQMMYATTAFARPHDNITVGLSWVLDTLVATLTRFIAFRDGETMEVPASWWDHLKQDRPWLQRLFGKPRFQTYTARAYHPDVPLPPKLSPTVKYVWYKNLPYRGGGEPYGPG